MKKKRASLFHVTDQEIQSFFRSGKRIFRHTLGDVVTLPKAYQQGRLIVIIPKRIAKAAHRNRVRRRCKALFYEHRLFEGPSDMMIIVKPDGINASFEELQTFLLTAAQKNAEKHDKKR